MSVPYVIIGNPELRRVTDFAERLAARGAPPPRIFAHLDLIDHPERLLDLPDGPWAVRIDAAGKNPLVERRLLAAGYPRALAEGAPHIDPDALAKLPLERGRVLYPRQGYLGMVAYLERLGTVFKKRPGFWLQTPIPSIVEMFDKRRTSARFRTEGIPIPEPILGVTSPGDLRTAMDERGYARVFVKLAYASSASGLLVLRRKNGHESAMTTLADARGGYFNARQIQRIDDRRAIDKALRFLLREGAQIEEGVTKARLQNRFIDCRVIVIAGRAAFTIVRASSHLVTNLQLGASRMSLSLLREKAGEEALSPALATAERAASLFGAHHAGLDLLFEPHFKGHRILEANAFGDFFPGLIQDGRSVFDAEIDAAATFLRA